MEQTNRMVTEEDLANSLAGITYPAEKQTLIKRAKKRDSDSEIVNALNGIPDRQYDSFEDILMELDLGEGGEEEDRGQLG